jgi:hypothetical protein
MYICQDCGNHGEEPIFNDHFIDYENPFPGDLIEAPDGAMLCESCYSENVMCVD